MIRIKQEKEYIKNSKKIDEKFQGRFLTDIQLEDLEIWDPKINKFINLIDVKNNKEEYAYLLEPL